MLRLMAGICFAFLANAQSLAVQNIQYYGLTHTSIRWVFSTTAPSCYQVLYGVMSGVYPYTSNSFCDTAMATSITIGGLAPSTTYYFRMTARPDADDNLGICNVDACGSPEFSVTTLPAPSPHPELPALPVSWVPSPPDTTNYFVIPMQLGGINGVECVAGANIPGAQVQAGDNIDTIFNEVPYGTVLEFPQAIECVVPANRNSGYVLPAKPIDPAAQSVDDPNHRWIVLRTAAGGSGDYPPFGARTGSAWAGKLAKLISVAPTTNGGDPSTAGKGPGQIFDAENGAQHHFWFQNLEFTTTTDPSLLPPPGTVDPPPYGPLLNVFPTFPDTVPPDISYIVLDRVLFYGQGYPSRYTRALTLGGRYQAMIGCSLENLDYWEIPVLPQNPVTVSPDGTTLAIPPSTYALNANSSSIGTSSSATAILTASPNYQGQYAVQIGPEANTLQILLTAALDGASANVSCTGCIVVFQPQVAVAANAFPFCFGTISNGQFSTPNCNLGWWQTTVYGYGWGTVGLELMDGGTGPYYLANNLFGAVGMGLYVDAGGDAHDSLHNISYVDNSNDDVVLIRNHFVFGEDHRITSPLSNGFHYPVRNLLETKRSRRWQMTGNVFQHYWSFQDDGAAILLAGAADTYAITNAVTGILDFSISSTIIRHGSVGIEAGGALAQYSAGEEPGNFLFENNLMYDLAGRLIYSDGDPSLFTGFFGGAARDITIQHNTGGLAWGDAPWMLYGDPSGALWEGLSFTDNLLYMSAGTYAGTVFLSDGNGIAGYLRTPRVDPSNVSTMLATAYVRLSSTNQFAPNFEFDRNVIIGGKSYYGAGQMPMDMTDSQILSLGAQFPSGNTFPVTGTNSLADREAQVGITDSSTWNYRLLPTSPYAAGGPAASPDGTAIGADFDRLQSDLGLVTNVVAPVVSGTNAQFQYTAPDANPCAVDITLDGVNWTRTADSGGNMNRQVAVPLSNPHARYQYRIICYYLQVNDGVRNTDYTPDQITSGTFGNPSPSVPSRTKGSF